MVDAALSFAMLRPYQQEIAQAVIDSVDHGKGLTFSVEIARQGGKNELSAQIERIVMLAFYYQPVNIVKCAPTFRPQCLLSMRRLAERLDDFNITWRAEAGHIIRVGEARAIFLSAEEGANVVGNTAHLLLEVDESQDVSKDKYNKDFRPMCSSTNATVVHYGTTWDEGTLLEEVKRSNLELEERDGIQRHFRYDWEEVAACVPAYRAYVEGERERLGEDHPLFLTQYRLLPPQGGGGLFTRTQIALLQGSHERQRGPAPGKLYVAGVDIAGEAPEGDARLAARHDRTVVTVAEIDSPADSRGTSGGDIMTGPQIRVVEHYAWQGACHPELLLELAELLDDVWKCRRVTVDATGIGEPVASFLKAKLGSKVLPVKFSGASKSEMGYNLLAAVNAGRLKLYKGDDDCLEECEMARADYRPDQKMNFWVEPSRGHDDYLMSLALCLEAARGYRVRRARG